MKGIVKEWIEKANADANTARREIQVVKKPNWDAVCFHVQQAIEKYLKALLLKDGRPPYSIKRTYGILPRSEKI